MAEDRDDQDGSTTGPSLEPPSLFKRKKKQPKAPAPGARAAEPVAASRWSSPSRRCTPSRRRRPCRRRRRRAAKPAAATPPPAPTPPPRSPAAAPAPAPVARRGARRRAHGSPLDPEEPLDTPRERPAREPWLVGRPAAVVTGLLVGALIVALTAGSQRVCSSVKGTSSCGGPGFFLLVAILIVAVLVGATLLRGARVPQPGSTSFLAVGLLSVVALLFLVDQLFEWWMVIAIPLVSVATYVLSHWVTTAFIEPGDDASDPALEPERHDVR